MSESLAIVAATPADLPGLLALLQRAKLPPDGIDAHVGSTLIVRRGNAVVGSAALELYGDAALLRSVAVDASLRGQGLGMKLTEAALDLARRRGARAVYLLTETAEQFFPKFGFRVVTRDVIPEAVKRSVEFTTSCCATAVAMERVLTHG
jgi:amino-acid N-acetyltransferase